MLRTYRADLHIHSCLSPCADLEMTPARIVREAAGRRLDIIAVSDHNSAENVEVTMALGIRYGLTVIPAIEITSSEEIHVLALFHDIESCLDAQTSVHSAVASSPIYSHDETAQPVVNERDEILYFNPRPLINATDMSLEQVVKFIHDRQGLAVACHVDRESFSVISQLGFFPDGVAFDAAEVSWRVESQGSAASALQGRKLPLVSFSDAHHPADIGRRVTEFRMESPTAGEMARAVRGEEGRSVSICFD